VKRSANRGDRSLAEEVLSYLSEHPEAQDTVEGITQWWLEEERIRQSVGEVTAVLSELAASKLVIARQGKDGRVHYRLNPKRDGTQQRSKST
jgi:hypothetical protein